MKMPTKTAANYNKKGTRAERPDWNASQGEHMGKMKKKEGARWTQLKSSAKEQAGARPRNRTNNPASDGRANGNTVENCGKREGTQVR